MGPWMGMHNVDGIFTRQTVQQCYEDSMETLKML